MTESSHNPIVDIDAVDHYLAGEVSAEEAAAMRWALARKPEALAAVELLRTMPIVIGATPKSVSKDDAEMSWWRHRKRVFGMDAVGAVGEMEGGAVPRIFRSWRSSNLSEWHGPLPGILRRPVWYGATAAIAATIFIVVGLVVGAHQFVRRAPATMMTYATANGQRGTVTLTDGSAVMLNVGSRLEVPSDYAMGDRTVRLVGEALITVSHKEGSPFTVLAGPTVTQVLGTSFVVRRYGVDTTTMVTVRDGKVAVDRAVVPDGQMIEVGSKGVIRAGRADASQFAFASGVLALRSVTLSQAIPALDRWYDVDIRVGDRTLGSEPFEGNLPAGSLADLVELLEVTFDVRVVRDGRVLTLFPR